MKKKRLTLSADTGIVIALPGTVDRLFIYVDPVTGIPVISCENLTTPRAMVTHGRLAIVGRNPRPA